MTLNVAVIGGGPAGLAAARELGLRGVKDVVVFDRETAGGGIPRHCNHPPFGLLEFGRLMKGPSYAQRLVETALEADVSLFTRHSVFEIAAGGRLRAASPEGLLEVTAKRIIIATGARESSRAARLISGDRPLEGCLTTGALQSFLHEYKIVPFRRPLIIGTELVGLSALLTCRRAGIRPVAVIEEARPPRMGRTLSVLPRLIGIPLYLGAEIVELRGVRQVESAALRLRDGRIIDIACDGLLCTGRLVPEAGILRASHLDLDPTTGHPRIDPLGRCSDHIFFAAGNVSHQARAAAWCYFEGRRIGRVVAEDLVRHHPAR